MPRIFGHKGVEFKAGLGRSSLFFYFIESDNSACVMAVNYAKTDSVSNNSTGTESRRILFAAY